MGSGKSPSAPPPEAPPPPPKPKINVDGIRDSEAALNARRNAQRQADLAGEEQRKTAQKRGNLGSTTQSAGLTVG